MLTSPEIQNVPKWLDETFVLKSLRTYFPDQNIKIHDFKANSALGKGENFLSDILRLTVTYMETTANTTNELQSKNLICKLGLSDPKVLDQISSLNIYSKEMEMYEKILPKIKVIIVDSGDDDTFFANTLYVSYEHNLMVFEDLVVSGYGMNKRQNGYDMQHAKMVLSKLAKFHAANAVLEERDPNTYANFRKGIFSKGSGGLTNMFEGQMDTLIDLVASWTGYEYYANKLRNMRPNLIEKCAEFVAASPTHFNTLIHGDVWTNNIMLAYDKDTSKLKNVAFIDFQFGCWTSPALDLHYFFNTSLEEEIRLHRQEELVQFYHQKLTNSLHRLNYKKHIPTLLQFQVQFLEKAFYGLTSALLVQPFMLNEVPVEADIHDLYGNHERASAFRRLVLSNEKVHANIKNLLPRFDRRGLLD